MGDEQPAAGARIDVGDAYERTRRRFVDTVGALTEIELATAVPATPLWSVRDVLAHVVGLAADLNGQRFPSPDDIGGAAWAARQVSARHHLSIAEVVSEWEREAPSFEDGLRLFGYETGCHFVADLHAHHQDVHAALGLARDDDPMTIAVALDHYLGFIDGLLRAAAWGTLDVTADDERRRLGLEGNHHAHVDGSGFEVLRAFSARRSEGQIRHLRWEGDLEPLLVLLRSGFTGGYAIPVSDVEE